jgi:hypothetical protein
VFDIENRSSQIRAINLSEATDQYCIAHIDAAHANELAAGARIYYKMITGQTTLYIGFPLTPEGKAADILVSSG